MTGITLPKIDDYLMRLTEESDKHILEMERIAKEKEVPDCGTTRGEIAVYSH